MLPPPYYYTSMHAASMRKASLGSFSLLLILLQNKIVPSFLDHMPFAQKKIKTLYHINFRTAVNHNSHRTTTRARHVVTVTKSVKMITIWWDATGGFNQLYQVPPFKIICIEKGLGRGIPQQPSSGSIANALSIAKPPRR